MYITKGESNGQKHNHSQSVLDTKQFVDATNVHHVLRVIGISVETVVKVVSGVRFILGLRDMAQNGKTYFKKHLTVAVSN
jgi:hypothetical protein